MTKTSLRTLLASAFALALSAAVAVPALADPAQRTPLPDVSLVFPNTCTGDLTTVTLSNRIIVIHDDVDPTGRQHRAGTITGDVATADGFSGRFVVTFGQNVRGPLIVGEFRGFLDANERDLHAPEQQRSGASHPRRLARDHPRRPGW